MRSNRLIISAFVILMGLIILAPQTYILHRFYLAYGDQVSGVYDKSEKATNAKDTVAMPFYTFSRKVGNIVQSCYLPFPNLAHAPDSQPRLKEIQLKVFETCNDTLILNDKPITAWIIACLGLILTALGLNLARLALGTKE